MLRAIGKGWEVLAGGGEFFFSPHYFVASDMRGMVAVQRD